jgi:hypothetical protein
VQQDINIKSIMRSFASSTGLTDLSREPRRYLWTDAFAVCNYLELYRQTGTHEFLELALRLVTQVHQILGKYRIESQHRGWLSGLSGEEAQQHPTSGGLRIGKKLNERQADQPIDESLEWDQDGQYFHYLTKWMYALNCVSHVTKNSIYILWAMELAKVAYKSFVYTPLSGGVKRMYWKMSIDLSRPLVSSMGHHDPLDGLITFQQLEATAKQFSLKINLQVEIENMIAMCKEKDWATEDALGIGGLLSDAYKLVLLIDTNNVQETQRLESLLEDIEYSLQMYVTRNQLQLPVEYRLAFREFGLSIGLHAISRMQHIIEKHPSHFNNMEQLISILTGLSQFCPISKLINDFWAEPKHHLAHSWLNHEDINTVMFITSLAPETYLSCKI